MLCLIVSYCAAIEVGTRAFYGKVSRIRGRTEGEHAAALKVRGERSVLIVGNSLLLEGVDMRALSAAIGPDVVPQRFVVESTTYLDWYYGLSHLLRAGSRPHVVVLVMSPTHWASQRTRGDSFAGLMLDPTDVPQLSRQSRLSLTETSSLLFATGSSYFANRADIRKWLIGRIVPRFERLSEELRPTHAPEVPVAELERQAALRLTELNVLCSNYGARLLVVVPPTNANPQAVDAVASAGNAAGVSVLVPLHEGVLSPLDYRDGFHLNSVGRSLFTLALATQLADSLHPLKPMSSEPVTQPAFAGSRDYFVSPAGSDAANGRQATPWKTLQHAADMASAGDVVHVQRGTYDQGMNIWRAAGGGSDAPISFLASPGAVIRHCALKGPNANLAAINIEASNWYVIDGFTIIGDGSMQRAGIRVSGSTGSRVSNNVITNAYIGIFTSNCDGVVVEGNTCARSTDEHGIYMGAGDRRCVVRRNRLFENHCDGLHTNATNSSPNDALLIEGNEIYANGLAGMDIEGTTNARIVDNTVFDNTKHGIVFHSTDQADTPACSGNVVVNNTIAGNGMFCIFFAAGVDAHGCRVFNNILISRSRSYGSIGTAEAPGELRSDYNAVVDRFSVDRGTHALTLTEWQSVSGQDQHSLVASGAELFVEPENQNFELKPASRARGAGVASFEGVPSAPVPAGMRPNLGATPFISPTTAPADAHLPDRS